MAPNLKLIGITGILIALSKWFLDTSNPVHVWLVRGGFLASQCFLYALLFYLFYKAKCTKEIGTVKVEKEESFEQTIAETKLLSVADYDQSICREELQRIAIGSAVTLFLHWKWDLYPPLIIQAVNQPYALLFSPLAKIYLFHQRAWGKLRRPWTHNNALTVDSQWKRWNATINSAISGDDAKQTQKASKGKEKAKKGSTKKKQ
uniref:Uncharacterized protein AlNc14C333G10709 n=1 Tax=Albugo laibachii Nc14 TaxID=890382 RepID=F0WWU6_9STRA|nr:conserved hypothetical protein [Albugo laibachii Nc14]|eukprot:CCA25923.1 conserved hypothetical protein [Albugo laibachii Nc14]